MKAHYISHTPHTQAMDMKAAQILHDTFRDMGLVRDDAGAIISERIADEMIDDSDYIPVRGEDESELTFTDRLLTDKALFEDHAGDALFSHDDTTAVIRRALKSIHDWGDTVTYYDRMNQEYAALGRLVYNEIMSYAEKIQSE